MNRILLHILSLLLVISGSSQVNSDRGEFATNPNGLMYNDNDMKTLRFIVDSLNLRFKSCDLNKTYYAYPQTSVYSISFRSTNNNLKEIIKEIEKKPSFQQIAYRFAAYINRIDSNELFIRAGTRNDGKGYYYLQGNPGEGYDGVQLDKEHDTAGEKIMNDWVYEYSPKDRYSKEYTLVCRYFPGAWKKQSIPDKYARLIQYVDCMIDTASSIFLTDKFSNGWIEEDERNHYFNLTALADFLDEKMSQKKINNKNIKRLGESQMAFAAEELKDDIQFKQLLSKTIDDYAKNQIPNHQLESLARRLSMYDKELLLKRCYRIMGSCSQDSRPREHARDIAVLSAQAHSWNIFLRAHLDIMNDRFERVSDGSYAWGERKTYLKELEELNLNIVDLILGLTLRSESIAANHYYGTIWRLGRALTESKEKEAFEESALAMVKDNSLDEFNRGLVFLLYKSYISYLSETEAQEKKTKLKQTVTSFPLFVQNSIQNMDEPKSRRR